MVAVDASTTTARALRYLHRIVHPGSVVRFVSIAENPRTLVPLGVWAGSQLEAARVELLRDAQTAVVDAQKSFDESTTAVETEVIDLCKQGGDVVHALAGAASRWSADLVVLGTRHHSRLLRWVEGEVSAPLAKLVDWPLLLVPVEYDGTTDDVMSRILFATDGSRASLAALRAATRLAEHGVSWEVVYVVDRLLAPGIGALEKNFEAMSEEVGRAAFRQATAVLDPLKHEKGWVVETAMIKTRNTFDDVPHTIDREARRWKAQLVVLGAHGRRGLTRWLLGSVAERSVRLIPMPLLLAPDPMDSDR